MRTISTEASPVVGNIYVINNDRGSPASSPLTEIEVLTAVDFRNAEIIHVSRKLQRLENRFCEGDPRREAIAHARRQVAKHYVLKLVL